MQINAQCYAIITKIQRGLKKYYFVYTLLPKIHLHNILSVTYTQEITVHLVKQIIKNLSNTARQKKQNLQRKVPIFMQTVSKLDYSRTSATRNNVITQEYRHSVECKLTLFVKAVLN